jgi:hypothetical protein
MLTKKLQMLVYSFMNKEEKVVELRQWNEFGVPKGTKKFPKQGFSNVQSDKGCTRQDFGTTR